MDSPRFLSSARRSASVMDRDPIDFSPSSSSYPPPARPGSPQLGSPLLSTSNRTDTHWPSYTRTISETRPFQHVYSIPKSYPPIPPLVFLSSPRAWRTSLPDFALPSSHDANMRGAGHLGSHSSELSSLSSQLDDDYDDETEGDDQLESQVGDVESEVESESEEEFDSTGEHCLNSEQKFQDQQYQANHAFGQFSSARSVFSATMASNGDSPQIVRIVELGPSPANPSAIITEDRHYPCPHSGVF